MRSYQRKNSRNSATEETDDDMEEEEEENVWDAIPLQASTKEWIWFLVARESRSVSTWAILAPLLKLLLESLVKIATYSRPETESWSFVREIYVMFSVAVGWMLGVLPRKVASGSAPGFCFASGWLLTFVSAKFGPIPNVPLRICEMSMGRLTLRELMVVLPVHFVCALSSVVMLRILLPSSLSSMAIAPIVYVDVNPWIVDLFHEIIVNAAFVVAYLVVPELLQLNKLPRSMFVLFMYPLYGYAVDSNGMGSTFGPNVLYALAASQRGSVGFSLLRFLGPALGGLLGGKIMTVYFPDDQTIQ